MNVALIASILLGIAIALPVIASNAPRIDKEEVFTRTGVRLLSEEEKSLLGMKISRAGLKLEPEYFQGIKVGLTSIYLLIIMALSLVSPRILFMLIGVPIVYLLPGMWLNAQIENRKATLKKRLDDFAMYLSTALNSVPDTATALYEAAKATGGVYNEEINIVIKEHSSGKNLMDALYDMSTRTDVDELNSLISSISQIYVHGAPASEKMQEFSDKIRESKKFDIMDQAGKLQVRLIFIVLIFMLIPILMVIGYPAGYALLQAL